MGGDIKMQHLGTRGRYHFTLSVFMDNRVNNYDRYEKELSLCIFDRASGNAIDYVMMQRTVTRDLVYDNPSCQQWFGFSATEVIYEGDFTFDEKYNADAGYIIVWERCCRNAIIRNIKFTPTNDVGAFYSIETKAFFDKNGKEFINNTPDFGSPNGSFLCVKDAMSLNMRAFDKDGDELRYSLVTPVKGFTDQRADMMQTWQARNFDKVPLVQWVDGFSGTSPIPSSVPITINAKTGLIEGKVSEVGFFVYAVMVEEFRNGERISITRREFQVAVVDCSLNSPPPPVITNKDIAIESLLGCQGDTFILKVSPYDPTLNYQWQYNDNNIALGSDSILKANQVGKYTVTATYKNRCASKVLSKAVYVKNYPLPDIAITPRLAAFCENTAFTIAVKDSTGNTYQWYYNQSPIANASTAAIAIDKAGVYVVQVKDPVYHCTRKDTLEAITFKPPRFSVVANALSLCKEDTLQLMRTNFFVETKNYTQQWFYENQAINHTDSLYRTLKKGKYTLAIKDANGCKTEEFIQIQEKSPPLLAITATSLICDVEAPDVVLQVNATEGIFSGKGVFQNIFSPKRAGEGTHLITYKGKGANGCIAETTHSIVVEEKIQIAMPAIFRTIKDKPVLLKNQINRQSLSFEWSPNLYLDNGFIQNPIANPPTPQTYVLKATSLAGCEAEAQTVVYPERRLYIPTAFTPNNDGRNDTWEISNLDAYPSSVVQLFNRWGELVFYAENYQNSFDGKDLSGQMLPSGGYFYRVKVFNDQEYVYEGALNIIR